MLTLADRDMPISAQEHGSYPLLLFHLPSDHFERFSFGHPYIVLTLDPQEVTCAFLVMCVYYTTTCDSR
jgi:hypothetical protein